MGCLVVLQVDSVPPTALDSMVASTEAALISSEVRVSDFAISSPIINLVWRMGGA